MGKKIYDYTSSQQVISEAWSLAIKHLEETLGEQYTCNITEYALAKFIGYVEQDIKYLKKCPVCGNVDIEGNFKYSIFSPEVEICYNCYLEEEDK